MYSKGGYVGSVAIIRSPRCLISGKEPCPCAKTLSPKKAEPIQTRVRSLPEAKVLSIFAQVSAQAVENAVRKVEPKAAMVADRMVRPNQESSGLYGSGRRPWCADIIAGKDSIIGAAKDPVLELLSSMNRHRVRKGLTHQCEQNDLADLV